MVRCCHQWISWSFSWPMLINAGSILLYLTLIRIDRHWDQCYNFDWHWLALGIDQGSPAKSFFIPFYIEMKTNILNIPQGQFRVWFRILRCREYTEHCSYSQHLQSIPHHYPQVEFPTKCKHCFEDWNKRLQKWCLRFQQNCHNVAFQWSKISLTSQQFLLGDLDLQSLTLTVLN